MSSDALSILLLLLILVVPVVLIVGLAMYFGKKSGRKRTGGPVNSSSSFNDINNVLD